jgi:hypothetical protein
MTYTITFGDGSKIEDLTLNGNNYVSQKEVTKDDFKDLSKVTIEDSEGKKEVHENCELVQIVKYNDGYYFIIRDLTPDELEKAELKKQLASANDQITGLQEALCDVYESTLS